MKNINPANILELCDKYSASLMMPVIIARIKILGLDPRTIYNQAYEHLDNGDAKLMMQYFELLVSYGYTITTEFIKVIIEWNEIYNDSWRPLVNIDNVYIFVKNQLESIAYIPTRIDLEEISEHAQNTEMIH